MQQKRLNEIKTLKSDEAYFSRNKQSQYYFLSAVNLRDTLTTIDRLITVKLTIPNRLKVARFGIGSNKTHTIRYPIKPILNEIKTGQVNRKRIRTPATRNFDNAL